MVDRVPGSVDQACLIEQLDRVQKRNGRLKGRGVMKGGRGGGGEEIVAVFQLSLVLRVISRTPDKHWGAEQDSVGRDGGDRYIP